MTSLFLAVLVASFFGSLHCAGMCGPLAILASSRMDGRQPRLSSLVAYHGGRIASYGVLGLIVGAIGSGLQETGTWFGAQRLASQLAGGSMLVIGLLSLANLASGTNHAPWVPPWLQTRLAQGHAWARKQPPFPRALAIGVLTAILPCGWLYAFLLVASGTADPILGALVMAIFGVGSIPALTGVVLSATMMLGPFRKAIPWCTAILVSVVGFYTLANRANADLSRMGAKPASTTTQLLQQVQNLDQENLPCCLPEEANR